MHCFIMNNLIKRLSGHVTVTHLMLNVNIDHFYNSRSVNVGNKKVTLQVKHF